MALKKCKECGNEVSSRAKTCPKCGIASPGRKSVNIFTVTFGIIIFIIIYKSCAKLDRYESNAKKNEITPKIEAKTKKNSKKEYSFDVIGGYKVNAYQESDNTHLAHFTPAIKRDDTAVKTVFGAIGQKIFNKKLSEISKFELSPTSKPGVNGIGVYYKDGTVILFVPYKNEDGSVHSALIEN